MDGHGNSTIRYASDEDRRKAEALAASLDAAMEELERVGPASSAMVQQMLEELEQEWAVRDAAKRSTR